MNDAGAPLRKTLNFNPELYSKALQDYANIQLKCVNHTTALLNNGLNDWQLKKLPDLYHEFVLQEKTLEADGLNLIEIKKLQNSETKFRTLCEKLSSYGIPESLEHGIFTTTIF